MKKKLLGWLTFIILVAGTLFAIKTCVDSLNKQRSMQEKITWLQNALAHSTVELQRDSLSDGREVVSQPPVIIDKTDYKRLEADQALIKELKLRIEQVESENRTLLATKGQVVFKTAADSDSILRYHDRWVDFSYLVKPRILNYNVRDSLSTFVSREYKHKFLCFRWGIKGYNVHIVSHNPNSSIEYNRYIKVEH